MPPIDAAEQSGSTPLNPAQVQQEAHKLEKIAGNFLSGNDEAGAFEAWQKEMIEVSKHGMGSIKAVFEQMQGDNKGLNPLLPSIDLIDDGSSLQLDVFPSLPNTVVGLNYRNIGTIVDPHSVFSSANAGRNVLVGQHEMTAYMPTRIEP